MPISPTALRFLGAGLLAMGAAACTPPHPPSVAVEDDWRRSIGSLGMFAVYPIAEDVQPGDIFLYAPKPEWDGRFDLTRVTSLARGRLMANLEEQQAGRLRFARLGLEDSKQNMELGRNNRRPQQGPRSAPRADVGDVDDDSAKVRMRRVAVPGFTAARILHGEIGGSGSSGNLNLSGGISGDSQAAVTVSLRDLEELSVDAGAALRMEWLYGPQALFRDMRPEMLLSMVANVKASHAEALCRGDFRTLLDAGIVFIVANRVIYAHGVDYDFHTSSSLAAGLAATIKAAATGQPPAAQPQGGQAQGGQAQGGQAQGGQAQGGAAPAPAAGSPAAAVAGAQVAADAMKGALQSLDGLVPGAPGVQAKFAIGRMGTTTLSLTYERPMAVAIGAPRLASLEQIIRAQAAIARGEDVTKDVDLPEYLSPAERRMQEQARRLARPMQDSFSDLRATCREMLAGDERQVAWIDRLVPGMTPVATGRGALGQSARTVLPQRR